MKAQGIRTSFIAKSIIAQAFMVADPSLCGGIRHQFVLPDAMPFFFEFKQWLQQRHLDSRGSSRRLILHSTVTKVDPITAIEGNKDERHFSNEGYYKNLASSIPK